MPSDVKRKLAAIMFTDIAGYTALSSKDENRALELLDKQEQILTPIIEEFNGTLHNRIGDGLLFTFQTVTDAIKCGIKIQKGTKDVEDLNLRIGIHEGEITLKNGDVLGDDVNVASRIDPFAAEGGIVISGKVQQNISSLPEFKSKFISEPSLKGVRQDVKVFCIVSHGLPETDITKVTAKLEKDVKKLWFNQKSIIATIGVLGILIVGIVLWINKNNYQVDNSQIDNSQDVHLIYIGSLEENINIAEWRAENLLSENEGAKVSLIDESELKNIRIDLESELYSEFFNQNLIIQMLKNDEEIGYVNNSIKEHGEPEALAGSIYKFFDRPKHIIFVRVYAIKSHEGEILQYVYDVFGALGDGWKNIMRSGEIVETIEELRSNILESLVWQIEEVKYNFSRWNAGEVIKREGDYVYINQLGLRMKKNMNLTGYRKWNLYDNDGDGFTDKDSSYYAFFNDVKEGLDYIKNTEKYNKEKIYLEEIYNALTSDSLRWVPKGKVSRSHRYSLKVVSVKDSVVIAELLEITPWTRVNVGDGISLD